MKSIAATEARERFADLLHEVSEQKQKFIIERRGKPCAVVLPLEDLEPIQGRVDQILHEGQQRLKDFAEASSDWFWEMDANCRFSYFSARFTEITGVPQEALLGKTREETGVPDVNPEEWEGHLADLAAHRSFRNFRHPRTRPDGQVVHLSINGKAIFDEAGNFRGYRGSGSDVTQFTRTQNELRESEEQLDLIAKTSNVPMFITRVSDGTYLYFNTAGAEIFGLSVEELVGRSSRDFYQDPSDRKKLLAEIQNKGSVQNLELRFKNVDGGTVWVLDSVIPLKYRGEDALLSTVIDITEHKQTEEALRENQEALARAQRQGQIGSWRWSIERDELISCSEEYANIHGVDLEEIWKLLEHQMVRVVHPDDRERVLAEFERVDEEGVDYKIEYRIVRPDGDIRHVLEIGEVVMDETGNAVEQTGTVQDITERKQAEEAIRKAYDELEMRVEQRTEELQRSNEQLQQEEETLRESEAQLDEALEAMSEGFIYFDAENQLVRANSKHRELFPSHAELMVPGARFEDLLRKQVQNIRLPWAEGREEPWIAERLAQHRNPGKPVEQEFADGRIIRLSEYRTKSGGTVSIRTDITEQKEVEKRLRESEARLKRAQEIARIGSFVWDGKNNEVIYRSDVICDIYGLPPYAAPKNFEETQKIMHPDDRERVREAFAAATDARTPYDVEYRIIRPDGEVRHVREMNGFQFDDKGALIGSEGTFQDITSLRQAEDALRQAQKMETVGQLTGGLSHDFNNLLAIIMGNAQLLEAKLKDDDVRELLEPMIGATKRGAELTSRLLAFSRQQPLNPRAIDIGELCMGMMTLVRRTLGETIEIDLLRENLSPARVDPGQLENALLNLALNARDAMPEGGKLTVEAENVTLTGADMEAHPEGHAGDYIMLKVTDTGTGMAPDVIERVFEPFFTTKDVGAGSGLGLSMVYGFARQSGGHLTIESEEGHGTTVALYLPGAETAAEDAQREAADEAIPRGQGESVLVVEDEPDLRRLTVRQLERLGYKTLEAPDGPAALTILADSGEIDLLLSDVVLPWGMNGPQIYQQVGEQRPNLRCLFMSGYAVTTEGSLLEGVNLLRKPFLLAELAKRLRSVLGA